MQTTKPKKITQIEHVHTKAKTATDESCFTLHLPLPRKRFQPALFHFGIPFGKVIANTKRKTTNATKPNKTIPSNAKNMSRMNLRITLHPPLPR
jgi:hypothetical protein